MERIVGVTEVSPTREPGTDEEECVAELAADLNYFAQRLLEETTTHLRPRSGPEGGRPKQPGLDRFMSGLQGTWMIRFDGRLAGSAKSALVRFLYSCCQELRAVLNGPARHELSGPEQLAACRIVDRLEDRERGLTREALRKKVREGVWLRLANDLLDDEGQVPQEWTKPRVSTDVL